MIIKFDTTPSNVEVYLNEEYVGVTPLDITDIEGDAHTYTLKMDESNEFHGSLQTHEGKATYIKFDFNDYSKSEEYHDIETLQQQQCPDPSIDLKISEEATVQPTQPPTTEQPTQPPTEQPSTEQPTTEPPTEPPTTEQPTTEQPTEPPSTEQPTTEQPSSPPAGAPEPIPPATLDDIVYELQKTNDALDFVVQDITEKNKPRTTTIYDNTTIIKTSVSTDPDDPVSNLYQQESVYEIVGHNAETIHIYNYGPGLLYVVTSVNGVDYTRETLILEGEQKDYSDIYAVGLRSPTAGLSYRVTERTLSNQASQQFTGSRFKDRRNRKGIVIFIDEMESPTRKFKPDIVGAGTITRSTDTAYDGDFSTKMVTGAAPNDNNTMKYFHPDTHSQSLGAQIRFASNASFYSIGITIEHDDGTHSHKGDVFALSNGGFFYIDSGGNNVQIPVTVPLVSEITAWNTMKVAIDVSVEKFVSAVINGLEIDLSTIPLVKASLVTSPHVEVFITLFGPLAGAATTAYFDNYIFTEDEVG